MHRVIDQDPYPRPARNRRTSRNGLMANVFVMWSEGSSHLSFSPPLGGWDGKLADMLARKQQKPYPVVISWLRCKLSFAAVRSSIMCIRGTRSSINRPLRDADVTLAISVGGIPQDELHLFHSPTHSLLFLLIIMPSKKVYTASCVACLRSPTPALWTAPQ